MRRIPVTQPTSLDLGLLDRNALVRRLIIALAIEPRARSPLARLRPGRFNALPGAWRQLHKKKK